MMQTMKRGLALFMVLMMCLAFLPALALGANAAEFSYVYDGKYIYNWGTRGVTATFLSPNAEKFYADDTYAELSAYSGGTGVSDAPDSALYDALHDLMKDNHSYETSYNATRDLYRYTDCQNNGGKISSFYSGKEIGPAWDGGDTWNREHTWPNSKGLPNNSENDIMMLRPTAKEENGARGNKAYGESSGYYNPNSESGGKHDLRGDVARIFLYIYVRWENVDGNGDFDTWGTRGVMESVDVLLAWMEADPVDTWELGRNDSVESITGTRNVFVDYPEFAFLLFGEEIPADMTTPSGEAGQKCDHNNFDAGVTKAATCTASGYTLYTCQTAGCGYSYKANIVSAKGHSYTNGACSVCGEAEPVAPEKPTYVTNIEVGKAYKLGLYSSAKGTEYFFTGTMSGYYGATATDFTKGVDVYAEQTNGGYHLYFKNASGQKQYISLVLSDNGEHRNFVFGSAPKSVFTWDAAKSAFKAPIGDEMCYMGTYDNYVTVGVLQTSRLKDTDYIARFYTTNGDTQDTPQDTPTCKHSYTASITLPTCTKEGFTTYTCSLCSNTYTDNTVSAVGHTYANGACIRCGVAKPANTSKEVTISFADVANRTVFTTSQQVWVQNGITVTNDKTSSSSPIADYSNPVRFYKGSNITVQYPGMTKIVIACNSASYANACKESIGNAASVNGKEVTITLAEAVDSFEFAASSAQIRVDSITVYAGASQEQPLECAHTNTTVEGAIQVTCTADGYTGMTRCQQCDEVINIGEVIPALGHKDANNDGICDTCSEKLSADEDITTPDTPTTPEDPETPNNGNTTQNQVHTCEEPTFFQKLWTTILNFFRKLLGMPELCTCGEVLNKEN